MFYSYKDFLKRKILNFFIKDILKTPQYKYNNQKIGGKLTILTLLQHKDMLMYLLAIKSFLRFVPAEKIVIIADDDLTKIDQDIIKSHIYDVSFFSADSFQSDKTPIGGCWERLNSIGHFATESYVIQLDSDTLTLFPPTDVITAISGNKAFILATERNQTFRNLSSFKTHNIEQKNYINLHIQALAEQFLYILEKKGINYYTRGCAGFSGFPFKSVNTKTISDLSEIYFKQLGQKWSEWGSEQFMSNLLISNCENSMLLPYPNYCTPDKMDKETCFLHFIGYLRFKKLKYHRLGSSVIKDLLS
jgi:hypothetical protein